MLAGIVSIAWNRIHTTTTTTTTGFSSQCAAYRLYSPSKRLYPSLPPHPVYGPLTLASTAPSLPPPSVCVCVCVCVQLKRRKGERNSLA